MQVESHNRECFYTRVEGEGCVCGVPCCEMYVKVVVVVQNISYAGLMEATHVMG